MVWRKGVALGEVTRVVDGDTVKVRSRGFETTVRLIGIDTPETRDPSQPVQCFGPEASARAKRLLPMGRRVRLVTDDTQDTRDRYGRLLAYVYVDRLFVNAELISQGYAQVSTYKDNQRYHIEFARLQQSAIAARRGMWGGCTDLHIPRVQSKP